MVRKSTVMTVVVLAVVLSACGKTQAEAEKKAEQPRPATPWEHKITDDLHVKKYPGNKVMWDLLTRLAYEMHDDALSETTNLEKWRKQRQAIRWNSAAGIETSHKRSLYPVSRRQGIRYYPDRW
ncbi:MAG: hypothetical protein KAV00_00015 [Phycisphaerae bacterium]|nr:hypothetical protein [Phycisphaerae bacterium]